MMGVQVHYRESAQPGCRVDSFPDADRADAGPGYFAICSVSQVQNPDGKHARVIHAIIPVDAVLKIEFTRDGSEAIYEPEP